jgi:hypothetical protein
MSAATSQVWPVAVSLLRTTALVAVTLVLILVVLPAVLAAAGPGAPIGG